MDDLSDELIEKLRAAHRRVVTWLARDERHLRLLIERPVAALLQAGLQLTFAEQRVLARAHERGRRPVSRPSVLV